jgi:hypothetical protein
LLRKSNFHLLDTAGVRHKGALSLPRKSNLVAQPAGAASCAPATYFLTDSAKYHIEGVQFKAITLTPR